MAAPRIGFVTCIHPYYDLPEVRKHCDAAIAGLERAGCEVVAPRIAETAGDAAEIAAQLKTSGVDLALLFFCTWVAEDITLTLAREIGELPLLLWGLPYLDKDVPMPSPISGLTASGSNIRRLGKPFVHLVGQVTSGKVQSVVRSARVAAVVQKLRQARFGLVGAPCPGMIDVTCDEAELARALGVTAVHLELDALMAAASRTSAEEAMRLAAELAAQVPRMEAVTAEVVAENLRLYVGMKQLVERHHLDAYCVRCWPELRSQIDLTVCLTHCRMSEDGITGACEIDLPALVTTYLLSQLAGAPAFSFDITGFLEEEGAIQFAHCGAANAALAGDPKKAALRRHMRTGKGVTLEFGFREGTVTLAKLLLPDGGRMRLFVARGQVIPTGERVRGSVATVRPEPSAAVFLDKMLREGVEHHVALVYGDWTRELSRLCEFTGLEPLMP